MKTEKSFLNFKKPEIPLTIMVFLILLVFNALNSSTGDSGDSIKHFLYSKSAFNYPEFFFHHWAKPVFVLLSAPFAQFGFKGMIVFNSLCAALIGLYTYRTAVNLKIENPWMVFLFLFFAPLFFALIFSGLTEYLFALFLIIGIYLFTANRFIFSLIIISFLPLIRSEGLIILIVFASYLLWLKKFKILPFLLTGQILYSIVGAFFYKDLFWLINEIPYASLKERYGSGSLFDFVHRLNYVIEKPIYLLLVIGVFAGIWQFFKNWKDEKNSSLFFLVLGSFLAVFVAHSFFWWKGIFNSMGLPRVLLAVIPAIALLALVGINWLLKWIKPLKVKQIVLIGICLLVAVFPFTNRSQGVVFNKNLFRISANEIIEKDVKPFLELNYPNYQEMKLYYTHPAVSFILENDYFNPEIHEEIHEIPNDSLGKSELIIWDNKMAVLESGVSLSSLKNRKDLTVVGTFRRFQNGDIDEFVLFASKK
jgi:hypothetical protein